MTTTTQEETIWQEKASMLDFLINPVLWILTVGTAGIWFILVYIVRLNTRYTLTSERLIITKGILSKSVDEIELFRIKDSKLKQSLLERIVGLGTISVTSTDATFDQKLEKMPNAYNKREQLRQMANQSRERKGIRTVVNE